MPHLHRHTLPLLLIGGWLLALLGLLPHLPAAVASWLAFIALLITPGFLLIDLVAPRIKLDVVERLAVALPLGITLLTLPGLAALLSHRTIGGLAWGWRLASALVVGAWLLRRGSATPRAATGWASHQRLILGLILAIFLLVLPMISLPKIDGDAYAVSTFSADAQMGLPLHQVEPLFGTTLGPGVRMLFNQSLPIAYLWSDLSGIDPIRLAASLFRGPFALWILLAGYTLGYGATQRRSTALLVMAIQFLIFLSAPFLRGDNISLFFFERTDADKFMVPMALLPVVVALTMRFLRQGQRETWALAALSTLAVSAIHPLIAAMLALALTAFAALHLLLADQRARQRVGAVGALVLLVMLLPLAQLLLARGDAPLAPSFPASFDGWPLTTERLPVLPGIQASTLDLAGAPPDLATLDAEAARGNDSPFLLWRSDVNMERRRLLFFDHDRYISDPALLFEPPYLLALLLLPLLWLRRRTLGAQYAAATTLAILFVIFNPVLTPLIGDLVMPWILWRFIWLLPTALTLALVLELLPRLQQRFVAVALVALLLLPLTVHNLSALRDRANDSARFPAPTALYDRLADELGERSAVVMADPDISVTLPAYVANAAIVAHRVPTTSEIFPADQQTVALQRLIDQQRFFQSRWLGTTALDLLARYNVQYVVISSGSPLESQLRLAPGSFTPLLDDLGYTLYKVGALPERDSATIRGNEAMAQQAWEAASLAFQAAITENPADRLATLGLVELDRINGAFDQATERLRFATQAADSAPLLARLGQLLREQGQLDSAASALHDAIRLAPHIPRYHIALGDICLQQDDLDCAAEGYRAAATLQQPAGSPSALLLEGEYWRSQGRWPQAIERFEEAVARNGSEYNRLILANALQSAGRYDEAAATLATAQRAAPLSVAPRIAQAQLLAQQGEIDAAIAQFERAAREQRFRLESPLTTLQAEAQMLLDAGRFDDAERVIDAARALRADDATTSQLRGDLYRQHGDSTAAIAAYRRALALDDQRLAALFALRDEIQRAGEGSAVLPLLEEALAANPDEPTLALLAGQEWQQQGDLPRAISAYQSALQSMTPDRLGPTSDPQAFASTRAFAAARLAESYDALGRPDAALNYYRAAVASAPSVAWPHVQLGDALRRVDQPEEAATHYDAAITADPHYIDGYLRWADLLSAQGQDEAAAALYDAIFQQLQGDAPTALSDQVGLTPLPPLAVAPAQSSDERAPAATEAVGSSAPLPRNAFSQDQALAALYQRQGDFEAAHALLSQRMASDLPPLVRARYAKSLGDLQLAAGQNAAARAAYTQSLAWDAGSPATHLTLSQLLIAQGDRAAARQQIEAARRLAPGAVDVQLAWAAWLQSTGESTAALDLLADLAAQQPGTSRATLAYGQALADGGAWEDAEAQFQRTLALHPGDAESYLAYAEFLISRGMLSEADSQLQAALRRDRSNVDIYLRLGEVATQRGLPDEAEAWQAAANVQVVDNQALETALLDRQMETGQFAAALAQADQLRLRYPASIELLRHSAQLYTRLGDHAKAEQLLQRALTLAPDNPRLVAAMAEAWRAAGRLPEAAQQYEAAIRLDPTDSGHYLVLSQVQHALGQNDAALATLERGHAALPEADELTVALAAWHREQAAPDVAKATLEAALAARPQSVALHIAMAEGFAARGAYEDAQRLLTQAIALAPTDPAPQRALGALRLQQGRPDQAIAALETARDLARADPATLLALAESYGAAGRNDDAADSLARLVALAPTLEAGYLRLSTLQQAGGDPQAATATLDQGLAALPASPALQLAYAKLLQERGESERANRLLDSALARAPSAEAFVARAEYYLAAEQYDAASADLHSALQQAPGDYQALLLLGDVARVANDRSRARTLYERAVAQQPGTAAAYLRLAGLALDVGDGAEAERLRELAIQMEPTVAASQAP